MQCFDEMSIYRYAGQVGYIRPGMRTVKEAHIGDTFHHSGENVVPLPGFKPAKPMVRSFR